MREEERRMRLSVVVLYRSGGGSRFCVKDWHGAAEHSEVDGGPGIRRHRTGQRAKCVAEIGQRKSPVSSV